MNTVLAERIVRDHTDTLMADAVRARLVRQAGRRRKGQPRHGRHAAHD